MAAAFQLQMFTPAESRGEHNFNHRSRGTIYTDKIWPQLSINQKINIRAQYYGDKHRGAPNYLVITNAIHEGLDKSPFASDNNFYTVFYLIASNRKFKNE